MWLRSNFVMPVRNMNALLEACSRPEWGKLNTTRWPLRSGTKDDPKVVSTLREWWRDRWVRSSLETRCSHANIRWSVVGPIDRGEYAW